MKRISVVLLIAVLLLTSVFTMGVQYTYAGTAGEGFGKSEGRDYATGPYYDEAQKKYGLDDRNTIICNTPAEIEAGLKEAGQKAKGNTKYIVYAVPGKTYNMTKKLEIPKNVILVAEKDTVFTTNVSKNFTQFFTVRGAVYGGTFDCNNKAYYGLRFADGVSYFDADGKGTTNGWIQYSTVKNAVKYGIVAINEGTQFCYIYKGNLNNCGASGIASVQGAWIAVINGCTITNSKSAGITITRSNVNVIKNCVISNNGGHGISTDVSNANGPGKAYSKINKIMGNTIEGNTKNGVYVDVKCKVTSIFSRNKINNNGLNGLSVDDKAHVGTEENIIIVKNTITKNKASNLLVGNEAVAHLGKENNISEAGNRNVSINGGGTVIVSGNGNKFNNAKGIGIAVEKGSTFDIKKGTKHQIQGNKGFGIKVDGGATAKVSYTTFKGNGGFAVKVLKGGKFTQKKTNLSQAKNAANRLYFEK